MIDSRPIETATSHAGPPPKPGALDHAVRVIHGVCCLAGSASLIDDIRAELRAEGVLSAIRRHDTATLFDWLISALSYQGISDQVATDYMERHWAAPMGRYRRQGCRLSHLPKTQNLLALPRLAV